ncbi:uncharacterized protein LOC122264536 [Penaeus japonicus]|uniref:uncharacterized protein LOC122264536 n=1 Tax=Penaeus japonicus TaxID=27405 RepID=UPI001C717297|nr:uncharacterized protein LOC122264536 [Penaeus japonicus]XP_042889416.1 uncharacterized protein LOC122264536 [Penaeus japonicus]
MKIKTTLLAVVVANMVFGAATAGFLDVETSKLDQFLRSSKWPQGAVCLAGVIPATHPKYSKCLGISQYLRRAIKNGCQGCSQRETVNINKLEDAMRSATPRMYALLVA